MTRPTPIIDNMHSVSAGELQGYIVTVKPHNSAWIFALELAIHTHNATITRSELGQQDVAMDKRSAERDIPDCGRKKLVIQFQNAYFIRIEPFMEPLFFYGEPPDLSGLYELKYSRHDIGVPA